MYEPRTNLYLASYVQNGDTHRVMLDDFDWANMVNLGYEMFDVEEVDPSTWTSDDTDPTLLS